MRANCHHAPTLDASHPSAPQPRRIRITGRATRKRRRLVARRSIAKIIDSPNMPEAEAVFSITGGGVAEASD